MAEPTPRRQSPTSASAVVVDDESIDRGTTGTTEIRVHGVSGTPPTDSLHHPLLEQVAGDRRAGFFRRWYPGGRSAELLRALHDAGWDGTLDMPALGLDWTDRMTVRDLITGAEYDWVTGRFRIRSQAQAQPNGRGAAQPAAPPHTNPPSRPYA